MCLIGWLADGRFIEDDGVLGSDALIGRSVHCHHDPIAAAATAEAEVPAGDRVVMLGLNGGPILSNVRSQPALLLRAGGTDYLVDCGGDAARQMVNAGLGFGALRHVFLTHHHLDHVAGYPEFAMLGWMYLRSPLRNLHVWGPPPIVRIHEGFVDAFSFGIELFERGVDAPPFPTLFTPHEVTLPPTGIQKVMEDDNVIVHGTRVFHGHEVKDAYAYRFDIKATRKTVVFSGDTAGPNDQLVALAQDADLLIHEVQHPVAITQIINAAPAAVRPAFREHLETTHTSVADLPRVAKAANARRVAMCHYSPGFVTAEEYFDMATDAATSVRYTGEIIAPTELDTILV